MDTEMLASRSGEMVELKSIAIFVVLLRSLLSHIASPSIETIELEKQCVAIYQIFHFYHFSSNRISEIAAPP